MMHGQKNIKIVFGNVMLLHCHRENYTS